MPTVTPGGRLTFSGTANDTDDLVNVEISLRNNTTREQLAADGSWGTDVVQDWYRLNPSNINDTSYSWSYQTPFNLTPGQYSFSVRATDQIGLTTSSTNQGRLTINAQVAGDAFPNGLLTYTGTDSSIETHPPRPGRHGHRRQGRGRRPDRPGGPDTGRYVQPNGTMAAAFATLKHADMRHQHVVHARGRPADQGRPADRVRRGHGRPAGHLDLGGHGQVPGLPRRPRPLAEREPGLPDRGHRLHRGADLRQRPGRGRRRHGSRSRSRSSTAPASS